MRLSWEDFVRTRLARLLLAWVVVASLFAAWLSVSDRMSFFRPMGRAVLAIVLAGALVYTLRVVRGRSGDDRRAEERRVEERREDD